MGTAVPAGYADPAIRALRYTLAVLDEHDRQAAGGDLADAPAGMTMEVAEAIELAPALALLAVQAWRELMSLRLATADPGEIDRGAREHLQLYLDGLALAALAADFGDG